MQQPKLSLVQQTLLEQLKALNPFYIAEYGVKAILNDVPDKPKGMGLRLHTRNNGQVVNIDITYRPVPDVYDIEAWRIKEHGLKVDRIAHFTEVYFDQLHDLIRDILQQK